MTNPEILKREGRPLDWPAGWPRTVAQNRRRSPFVKPAFVRDRDEVIRRLGRRGTMVVITSDLPLNSMGLPSGEGRCADPGIAVWWVERGRERVMACDRWLGISENMRAVNVSLQALAGLDRWGAAEMVERAFSGFAALPPGSGEQTVAQPEIVDWRGILEINEDNARSLMGDAYSEAVLLSLVKTKFRNLMAKVHPDRGGDVELAARLNAAMAAAEAELR